MSEDNKKMPSEEEVTSAAEETVAEEAKAEEAKVEDQAQEEATSEENKEADAKEEEAKESERYMRLMAEFQNFKKRTAKEKSDIHAYANEKIVVQLLEVLDNFERALASEVTEENAAYAEGMNMIFTQLKTVLEKSGLKECKADGEDFDPSKHNAVMAVDDPELGSGKVKQVLQKGYELNGKVIRPAMVMVTN